MSHCAHVQSTVGRPGILDYRASFFPVSRLMTGFASGVCAIRTEWAPCPVEADRKQSLS